MLSPSGDKQPYDCVVIGGGPAGATVATLLADHGRRVVVLERSHFPRHHIGESLMPQTYGTFKRLGMLEKLKLSDFPRKESVQFVSAEGKDSQPYYFTERDPSPWSITWQVQRNRFDTMMLKNAQEHGAQVRQNTRVTEVCFDGDRAVGVKIDRDGKSEEIAARVVVDASGSSTLLSRQLKLRTENKILRNGAIYSYYRGAFRDSGRNAGATLVIHAADRAGWFWSIPLPDDVTSVGVVAPPAFLFAGRGDDPLKTFEELIELCPGISRRLKDAKRIADAYVTSDFSYGSRQMAGNGWVLVGDAYSFLDPVYSSGVFLAMKGGELAAGAIHQAFEADDTSADRLGGYGPGLCEGMSRMERLVHSFYDPSFSFGKFNRKHPEFRDQVVRLLIGDLFGDDLDPVLDAMRDMSCNACT